MDYSHIPQKFATPINAIYQEMLTPRLRQHRLYLFATERVNDKGKITKHYRHEDVKNAAGVFNDPQRQGLGQALNIAT